MPQQATLRLILSKHRQKQSNTYQLNTSIHFLYYNQIHIMNFLANYRSCIGIYTRQELKTQHRQEP